jgi:hypothetical protein
MEYQLECPGCGTTVNIDQIQVEGTAEWLHGIPLGKSSPVTRFEGRFEDGFEGCDFFIFVMSKASLKRPWVQAELDIAVERQNSGLIRKIIPIMIEQCIDIPPFIRSICWEDFTSQLLRTGP